MEILVEQVNHHGAFGRGFNVSLDGNEVYRVRVDEKHAAQNVYAVLVDQRWPLLEHRYLTLRAAIQTLLWHPEALAMLQKICTEIGWGDFYEHERQALSDIGKRYNVPHFVAEESRA
jgi:hypothetical protein